MVEMQPCIIQKIQHTYTKHTDALLMHTTLAIQPFLTKQDKIQEDHHIYTNTICDKLRLYGLRTSGTEDENDYEI